MWHQLNNWWTSTNRNRKDAFSICTTALLIRRGDKYILIFQNVAKFYTKNHKNRNSIPKRKKLEIIFGELWSIFWFWLFFTWPRFGFYHMICGPIEGGYDLVGWWWRRACDKKNSRVPYWLWKSILIGYVTICDSGYALLQKKWKKTTDSIWVRERFR